MVAVILPVSIHGKDSDGRPGAPAPSALEKWELAFNEDDANLYIKRQDGTVYGFPVESLQKASPTSAVAGNSESKYMDAALTHLAIRQFIPAGIVSFWAAPTPPTGWLKANGAELDRVVYSDLFDAIGTTYGAGDSTTFNLPDLRGVFIRGWDDGRGLDPGRVFGSYQEDTLQNITGTIGGNRADLFYSNGAFYWTGANESVYLSTVYAQYSRHYSRILFDASRVARTSDETKGKNLSLLPIIKY